MLGVLPSRWLAETSLYPNENDYMSAPGPEAESMESWEREVEPGDAVALN
ncbi:hypothetical protein [Tritonibacter mobilis]